MKPRLYIALVVVLVLLACGRVTPEPTATLLPAPTNTPVPPTPTSIPPTATMTPTPTLAPGATKVSPIDGIVQVYVPAGTFLMGTSEEDIDAVLAECAECARSLFTDEMPQHEVVLDAFWIDQTEVTNAMYARCVREGACDPPLDNTSYTRLNYYAGSAYADYPVIYVSWQDASNYCAWAGRRLPTEAEWEKAARGTDGRQYPWGDSTPSGETVNFCDVNCEVDWRETSVNDGYEDTSPVGTYAEGASPYGALDMAGNVWEWVADWYDADYYSTALSSNPQGPATGEFRVLRGGAWDYYARYIRAAERGKYDPIVKNFSIGFRCAGGTSPSGSLR